MAVYASADDLRAFASDSRMATRHLPRDADAIERLLQRGERAVDLVVGPRPRDETTGLKFDPEELTPLQADTLRRATLAYCIWELLSGVDLLYGGPDYMPSAVVLAQRAASEAPQMLRELAGSGLVLRPLTVEPEPLLPLTP
jgi:hypothetical protein